MSAGKPEKKNRTQSTRTQGAARAATLVPAEASVGASAVIRALSREMRVAARLSKGHVRFFARADGAFTDDGSMRHRVRSGKLPPPTGARRSAGYGDGHDRNGATRNQVDQIMATLGWPRQQHHDVPHECQDEQTAA